MLRRMIALQEELDWQCYTSTASPTQTSAIRRRRHPTANSKLGQRAFEIVMARKMAAGELETTWFERHAQRPSPTPRATGRRLPPALVERRIALIEQPPDIALIERPEYKRRWNTEPWEEQEQRALRNWLLDRLEDARYWPEPPAPDHVLHPLADTAQHATPTSCRWRNSTAAMPDFDVPALVAELVAAEAVPFLPVLRYKASGLRKRAGLGAHLGAAAPRGRRRGGRPHPCAAEIRCG